jgi:raffinose/stachyose/melibiose transport system permease protein
MAAADTPATLPFAPARRRLTLARLGDLGGITGRNLLLLFYAALVIYPLILLLLNSFKDTPGLFRNPLGIPTTWTTANYANVMEGGRMARYVINSFGVSAGAVAMLLICAGMIAYAIVRLDDWRGVAVFALITVGMMIPTQANMIPLYMLLANLGLLNNPVVLALVYVAFLLPLSVFILTGFMRTISHEILEAAVLDGASEWNAFLRVYVPLSMPAFATVAILTFVRVWNDLLFPLLFIKSEAFRTLPLALLRFQGEYTLNYPVLFSGAIVSMLPLLVIYVFLQRYFVAGLTAGSVKG